jgi:hypothetical protein
MPNAPARRCIATRCARLARLAGNAAGPAVCTAAVAARALRRALWRHRCAPVLAASCTQRVRAARHCARGPAAGRLAAPARDMCQASGHVPKDAACVHAARRVVSCRVTAAISIATCAALCCALWHLPAVHLPLLPASSPRLLWLLLACAATPSACLSFHRCGYHPPHAPACLPACLSAAARGLCMQWRSAARRCAHCFQHCHMPMRSCCTGLSQGC